MLIYKYKQKNSEVPRKSEKKSSIFVKHTQSEDEATCNLYSSCCLKHGYFKPKCHNLHNVQLIFCICSKNCANKLQNFPTD